MASEGGGGADLVGFLLGLVIIGALIQTAVVQFNTLANPEGEKKVIEQQNETSTTTTATESTL
jgi:mannose/fructose/N-acetylgalactosamine-specific phosphotransferase system component IID